MKKGDFIISRSRENIYQIAGRWGKDFVLVPIDEADEHVLIYSALELEDLIERGSFGKLHPTGIKVKTEE